MALALCLLLGTGLTAGTARAGDRPGDAGGKESVPEPVLLECRLGDGPWQHCQMRVVDLGVRWRLLVAGEQIGFQHDGRGNVRMQRSRGGWIPVQAHWSNDAALCWDGVCARGDLPLD